MLFRLAALTKNEVKGQNGWHGQTCLPAALHLAQAGSMQTGLSVKGQ